MQTRSSPDVLLLDLILVGIAEGLIETERDLVRLYVWLCAVTRRRPLGVLDHDARRQRDRSVERAP